MPSTTTNLGLTEVLVGDAATEYRLAINANATALDPYSLLTSVVINTGSATVSRGQSVIASPSTTQTLPTATANAMVAIAASSTVTGPTAVTVSGSRIYGVGLSNATSFPLGTPGAYVLLQSDGTNWYVVGGQQDTGWVALTMASNVSVSSGPTLNARLTGNVVRLASVLITSATVSTFFTVPASMKPASQQVINPSLHVPSQLSSVYPLTVNTSTGVASAFYTDDGSLATNNKLGLDGLTYPIS